MSETFNRNEDRNQAIYESLEHAFGRNWFDESDIYDRA